MEDSLILAVLQYDIQTSISLLSSGACTNITNASDQPLLHLALALELESQALAMMQLLLINGANPECMDKQGKTAVDLAKGMGREEVVRLLVGFGAIGDVGVENVAVTFHKYVFEDEEEKGGGDAVVKGGLHFLEQVANIFQGSLEGVKRVEEEVMQGGDFELGNVMAQLDSVGFRAAGRLRVNCPSNTSTLERRGVDFPSTTSSIDRRWLNCPSITSTLDSRKMNCPPTTSTLDRRGKKFTCSTPSRRGFECPSLDLSLVSGITAFDGREEIGHGRSGQLGVGSSPARVGRRGEGRKRGGQGDGEASKRLFLSVSDCNDVSLVESVSSQSFHSCRSNMERSVTMLASSSLLSVCQEFIISDKSHGLSMVEKRMPSLLGVALQDQILLDQLQAESENMVGERSSLALSHTDSITSVDLRTGLAQYGEAPVGPITASTRTAYLRRLKKLRLGLVVPASTLDSRYPAPMAGAFKNISTITRHWVNLSTMEQEMAFQFNNIPSDMANMVNCLTRETVCKASFNYLLLDPRLTQNLPMRVFSSSDQELWRTFLAAIFYVGKGSRSRPFQHLYEAIKLQKTGAKKKLSEKIKTIHDIWDNDKGVIVVQVFQNTIAVEAFTREAAMIDAIGCDNLSNVKGGDYYGVAAGWGKEQKLNLGTFLVFKAFKIFLQEGERQIRPVDLRS